MPGHLFPDYFLKSHANCPTKKSHQISVAFLIIKYKVLRNKILQVADDVAEDVTNDRTKQ